MRDSPCIMHFIGTTLRGGMSYEDYKQYAKSKGFQPLGLEAFEAMVRAGFNFELGGFV